MKKKILIGLLVFCQGMANAQSTVTVTFDATVDKGSVTGHGNINYRIEDSISKSGIRICSTDAEFGNGANYRIYSLSTLTISSHCGRITQIIFNRDKSNKEKINCINKPSSGNIRYSEDKIATWSGESSNITFYVNGTIWLSTITVTFTPNSTSTLSISESQYATIYLNDAFVMPEGVTGHTISDVQGRVTYGTTYTKGDVVPAQTPLLLEGAQGTYTYYTTTTTATAPTNNMLRGSTGEMVDDSGYLYYKLCYKSASDKTVGFFWDTADGHSINIGAGKAYLAVPESSGAKGYTFDDAITGISAVPCQQENDNGNHAIREQSSVDDRIFDLYGRCVGRGAPCLHTPNLPKGIYIYQGKRISTF